MSRFTDALHTWTVSRGEEDLEPVLEALYDELKRDMEVLMPVTIEGSIGHPEADQRVTFEPQVMELATKQIALPVFTDGAEFAKGEPSANVTILMREAMQRAIDDTDCFGLVVNPWGDGILLPKPLLCNLVAASKPFSEADLNFRDGYDAFAEGDYDKAIALYTSAANDGHLEAMRNLGFCYAFIVQPPDFVHAKQCWETASQKGDVASLLLLGDMYWDGTAGEENRERAKAMYRNAWLQTKDTQDCRVFPDACLRILRYARDGFDLEKLYHLSKDCVRGLEARREEDDKVPDAMLEEAIKLRDELKFQVLEMKFAATAEAGKEE